MTFRMLQVWFVFRAIFIFRGVHLQVNCPFRQSISRLFSLSQGWPKMSFCFPSPVTSSFRVTGFPLTVTSAFTKVVINSLLFFVPSTLRASIGTSSFRIFKFISLANCSSTNSPPALQSMSALVSTIFDPCFMLAGNNNEFSFKEHTWIVGGPDVDTGLPIKNPLSLLRYRILPTLFRPSARSRFECGWGVLFGPFSSGCTLVGYSKWLVCLIVRYSLSLGSFDWDALVLRIQSRVLFSSLPLFFQWRGRRRP